MCGHEEHRVDFSGLDSNQTTPTTLQVPSPKRATEDMEHTC